jgi:uncharacterized protein YlxW (UPF0749 family)
MTENKVISFRASGSFLDWLRSHQVKGESESQTAQRLLKSLFTGQNVDLSTLSTLMSTDLSTLDSENVVSTAMSTELVETVDKLQTDNASLLDRIEKLEERLGKLRA